jgi:hypothetical protein
MKAFVQEIDEGRAAGAGVPRESVGSLRGGSGSGGRPGVQTPV